MNHTSAFLWTIFFGCNAVFLAYAIPAACMTLFVHSYAYWSKRFELKLINKVVPTIFITLTLCVFVAALFLPILGFVDPAYMEYIANKPTKRLIKAYDDNYPGISITLPKAD